jgi:uncharacterized protein YlxP (DUF503 family)
VCRLTLRIRESGSLKEKRAVLRRIKDRTRQKFNLAIAEVGAEDDRQRSQLGIVLVANDRRFVESMLGEVRKFVDQVSEGRVVREEKEFLAYGEDLGGDVPHWEP